MDGRVRVQFGVEGRDEHIPLAGGNGDSIHGGENLDIISDAANGGGADEGRRDFGSLGKWNGRGEAAELPPVGVAPGGPK